MNPAIHSIHDRSSFVTRRLLGMSLPLILLAAAACSGTQAVAGPNAPLRLGYLTNLTHATALVGVKDGYFKHALGKTELKTSAFNAGPDEVEGLLSNSLDAAFIGPNPAINAFVRSHGSAVRIVAGATSGGAGLVVKPSINSAADLKGKTVASPQLGNTQDVALRYWLKQNGLSTTTGGGGDVHVQAQENATTLQTFEAGQIDGAWVPEPWLSRLVIEGHGKVLVNENALWPGGDFATVVLLVRTDFLKAQPGIIKKLLQGVVDVNRFLTGSPQQARADANAALKSLTTKSLKTAVIESAWQNLKFTEDPLPSTIEVAAKHAHELGLLPDLPDLKPMFSLGLLNEVLRANNLQPVGSP